eukprot:6074650-Pyramimonas_sp.AAC.1
MPTETLSQFTDNDATAVPSSVKSKTALGRDCFHPRWVGRLPSVLVSTLASSSSPGKRILSSQTSGWPL